MSFLNTEYHLYVECHSVTELPRFKMKDLSRVNVLDNFFFSVLCKSKVKVKLFSEKSKIALLRAISSAIELIYCVLKGNQSNQ